MSDISCEDVEGALPRDGFQRNIAEKALECRGGDHLSGFPFNHYGKGLVVGCGCEFPSIVLFNAGQQIVEFRYHRNIQNIKQIYGTDLLLSSSFWFILVHIPCGANSKYTVTEKQKNEYIRLLNKSKGMGIFDARNLNSER